MAPAMVGEGVQIFMKPARPLRDSTTGSDVVGPAAPPEPVQVRPAPLAPAQHVQGQSMLSEGVAYTHM